MLAMRGQRLGPHSSCADVCGTAYEPGGPGGGGPPNPSSPFMRWLGLPLQPTRCVCSCFHSPPPRFPLPPPGKKTNSHTHTYVNPPMRTPTASPTHLHELQAARALLLPHQVKAAARRCSWATPQRLGLAVGVAGEGGGGGRQCQRAGLDRQGPGCACVRVCVCQRMCAFAGVCARARACISCAPRVRTPSGWLLPATPTTPSGLVSCCVMRFAPCT